MMRFRPRHVRTRLALWCAGVVGIVLFTYICGAALLQFWQLSSQIYHDEVQDVETAEGLLYFAPDGSLQMRESYHNHRESLLLIQRLMEVLSPDGAVLYRNARLGARELGGKVFPDEGQTSYNERNVRLADGTWVLLISHVHSIDGRALLIRLAYSLVPLQHRMTQLAGILLLALPVTLVVAGFAVFKLARSALAPLEDMALRTEQITATSLRDRLPIENKEDELGHVGAVLNGLLERLDESFERLRRFNSDVSHELRTPLASLRSVGEVGLQKEHSAAQYRDIIGSMLEEVSRLTQMVESLLTISKADTGQLQLQLTVFSMLDLLREASALVEILAEEKEQTLIIGGDWNSFIQADRLFVRQAVINILDNAVKYSPFGGEILATVSRRCPPQGGDVSIELDVIDRGSGVPECEQDKIFDRFYRVDKGRSRNAGGAGLGLAIAQWAIHAQGGTIGVKTASGGGCHVFIRMTASGSAGSSNDTLSSSS